MLISISCAKNNETLNTSQLQWPSQSIFHPVANDFLARQVGGCDPLPYHYLFLKACNAPNPEIWRLCGSPDIRCFDFCHTNFVRRRRYARRRSFCGGNPRKSNRKHNYSFSASATLSLQQPNALPKINICTAHRTSCICARLCIVGDAVHCVAFASVCCVVWKSYFTKPERIARAANACVALA